MKLNDLPRNKLLAEIPDELTVPLNSASTKELDISIVLYLPEYEKLYAKPSVHNIFGDSSCFTLRVISLLDITLYSNALSNGKAYWVRMEDAISKLRSEQTNGTLNENQVIVNKNDLLQLRKNIFSANTQIDQAGNLVKTLTNSFYNT